MNTLRLTQRSRQRFILKYRSLEHAYAAGTLDQHTYRKKFLPLLAFISHAHTHAFRESLTLPIVQGN